MKGFYIFGFVAWLCLVNCMLALEPIHKWLVKNRWVVDDDKLSTQ